ncbi:MAG: NRDE family protein [Nevskia sp.]
MCLIAFAWNAHPRYPLALIANRDEFHARPTAPLAPWTEAPDVLGGRDLKEGGGWLALHRRRRRLVAVTNIREPAPALPPKSRGHLVRDYITGDDCAVVFAEMRRVDGNDYGGFNLILWDGDELIVATNRLQPRWETVARGVHGISNGAFDAPWPKTTRLMASLEGWLAGIGADAAGAADIEPLFAALADERRPPDAALPDTGIGLERERLLSSAFIRLPGYGTRASSVILIDRDGNALFAERSFGEDGAPAGERRHEAALG